MTPGTDVYESLQALLQVIDRLQPVEYSLFRRRDWAVVVMSDASFNMRSATGQIGVALFGAPNDSACSTQLRLTCASSSPPCETSSSKRRTSRNLSLLPPCAPTCHLARDVLADRLVHHFIDNKAARTGLIKGSSGKADSARIINTMHVTCTSSSLPSEPNLGSVLSIPRTNSPIYPLGVSRSRNPLEATSASSRHLAPRGGLASCHALTSGQSRAPRAPGSPGPPDPTDR